MLVTFKYSNAVILSMSLQSELNEKRVRTNVELADKSAVHEMMGFDPIQTVKNDIVGNKPLFRTERFIY